MLQIIKANNVMLVNITTRLKLTAPKFKTFLPTSNENNS